MAMHPHFPDWYRSAALTPQAETLNARWAAVEDLCKEPTAALILGLARLFCLSVASEDLVPAAFREAFRKHDATFPMRNNLQELRVLAGSMLRLTLEQGAPTAPLAALALVCGSFGPRLAAVPFPEHIEVAQRYLVTYARETRSSSTAPEIKVPSYTKAKLTKALPESAFNHNPPTPAHEPLLAVLTDISSALSTGLEQTQQAIDHLSHSAAVREEEVAILWWLQTQFSRRLEKSFSEVGYVCGALLFPTELADFTAFVPGSDSIVGVLVRALQHAGVPSSVEPLTLAAATNALSRDTRERIAAESKAEVPTSLTPVFLAIQKSLETDGNDDWFPVYRKACDLPVDRPFAITQLSLQFFRELMLLRATSEAM